MYDQLGFAQIVPYIKIISQFTKVTVLSFEKKRSYSRKKIIDVIILKNKIKHIKLNFIKKYFFFIKFIDLLKLILIPIRINFKSKFKFIHCRGHLPAFSGYILKKFYKGKYFIFDCRGFWADERLDFDWNLKNPIHNFSYKIIKYFEKIFFLNADISIVLTYQAKKIIIDQYKLDPQKIKVIPCVTDYKEFFPISEKKILFQKKKLNLENSFIIGYFGSLNSLYMPEKIYQFFQKVKLKSKKNIKLLICSTDLNKLNDYPMLLNDKDIIIKNVNPDKVNLHINLCNITLCFVKNTYAMKAASPTKIAQSLACGVPIICNSGIGDLDITIPNIAKNAIFNVNNEFEMSKTIDEILKTDYSDKQLIIYNSKKFYDLNLAKVVYKQIYNLK